MLGAVGWVGGAGSSGHTRARDMRPQVGAHSCFHDAGLPAAEPACLHGSPPQALPPALPLPAQGRLAAEADAHARDLAGLQRFLDEQCARHGIPGGGEAGGQRQGASREPRLCGCRHVGGAAGLASCLWRSAGPLRLPACAPASTCTHTQSAWAQSPPPNQRPPQAPRRPPSRRSAGAWARWARSWTPPRPPAARQTTIWGAASTRWVGAAEQRRFWFVWAVWVLLLLPPTARRPTAASTRQGVLLCCLRAVRRLGQPHDSAGCG